MELLKQEPSKAIVSSQEASPTYLRSVINYIHFIGQRELLLFGLRLSYQRIQDMADTIQKSSLQTDVADQVSEDLQVNLSNTQEQVREYLRVWMGQKSIGPAADNLFITAQNDFLYQERESFLDTILWQIPSIFGPGSITSFSQLREMMKDAQMINTALAHKLGIGTEVSLTGEKTREMLHEHHVPLTIIQQFMEMGLDGNAEEQVPIQPVIYLIAREGKEKLLENLEREVLLQVEVSKDTAR